VLGGITREGDVALIVGRNLAAHYRQLHVQGCSMEFEAVFLSVRVSVSASGEILPSDNATP